MSNEELLSHLVHDNDVLDEEIWEFYPDRFFAAYSADCENESAMEQCKKDLLDYVLRKRTDFSDEQRILFVAQGCGHGDGLLNELLCPSTLTEDENLDISQEEAEEKIEELRKELQDLLSLGFELDSCYRCARSFNKSKAKIAGSHLICPKCQIE